MATTINPVRRTLVLTTGTLADAAGKVFADRLHSQQGPETAVAVIHTTSETANGSSLLSQMTEALTRISPPNLGRLLAETGWQLGEPRLLHLILLLDTAVGAEQQAAALGQTAVEISYRHLGVDSKVTLIWLAADLDAAATTCVSTQFSFAPQVFALSPLNEAGLRLPEVDRLSHVASELVWSLSLTPFYQFLAESLAATEDVYTGETPVTTMGVAVWQWSPTAVYQSLRQRWHDEVFASWLAQAETDPTQEELAVWVQQAGLDREQVATAVVEKGFVPPPDYARTAQHWPWPWEIGGQIMRLKEMYRVDAEVIAQFKLQAEPYQLLLKGRADEQLAVFLGECLDEQPVGGVDRAARWTWQLQTVWAELYEQMLDETATYDGIDHDLAGERGLIEAQIRELLENWPGPHVSRWLVYAWRVWRWPSLGWRYWQLRQLGLRLGGLLSQQSARRRQQTVQSLVAKTVSELAHQARQWHGRVTEIEQMLKSSQRPDGQYSGGGETCFASDAGIKTAELPGEMLSPAGVYERLLPDADIEAAAAAAAIGGLGRQLRLLDDAVLQNLDEVAAERLRGLWLVTAVDLLEGCHNTPEAWQAWWQTASQMASPLWPYDEGQLSEQNRRHDWTSACLLGAGVERIPALPNWLGESGSMTLENTVPCISTADSTRLVVLCLRRGATVGNMAAVGK